MDHLKSNTKDTGLIDNARQSKRERDRACAALMTDEQREEKNRKRREAYKRKQCHAHNKENDLVALKMSNGTNNADGVCIVSAMDKNTSGSALLIQKNCRTLAPLRSIDESIGRSQNRLEANQKLIQGSDRILTPLGSDDEIIGRSHNRRHANQKQIQGSDRILTPLLSDGGSIGDHETQRNAIGSSLYSSKTVSPLLYICRSTW